MSLLVKGSNKAGAVADECVEEGAVAECVEAGCCGCCLSAIGGRNFRWINV